MMAAVAARELRDGEVVFVGIGLPNLACNLARGTYARPTVRLPGSGGAAEIAVHAQRTLIVAKLNPRAFPERVDFVTSPGQQCGGRGRRELGMPGAGPVKVITDKGVLEADATTG